MPNLSSWRRLALLGLFFSVLIVGLRGIGGEAPKAVQFVFDDLEGRTVRLADYRGKWVLVSFWAPWCPLCKIQVPTLNSLNQRPDFRVIGIALDYGDDLSGLRASLDQSRLRFDAQVAGGSRKSPNSAMLQVGPVDMFPTSYLYDPTGEVVMFIPGQVRLPAILAFMRRWQAERGGPPAFAAQTERLAAYLRRHYGDRGNQAFQDWKRMLDAAVNETAKQKLGRVNDFFNRRIAPSGGRDAYWASPGEVLGSGRGSSEDVAIAKYFSLAALNVAPEQLRLFYVRTRAAQPGIQMVLAWYDKGASDPLLLDAGGITPAARRPDLQPIYSFNSLGVWDETAKAVAAGDPGRLATWEDALRRAHEQGFE